MEKNNLTERISNFNQFRKSANQTFKGLARRNQKLEKFLKRHKLHVDPQVITDEDTGITVEVSFGVYPIFGFGNRKSYKNIGEIGASLFYTLNDDGYVAVLLYPCETENIKRKESLIFLEKKVDPLELLKSSVINSHFQKLCIFMENTSVFGNPSFFEKAYFTWILFSNPLIEKSNYQAPRVWKALSSVGKYVLTVGLSGGLLFLIQWFFGSNEIENASLLLNKELNNIEQKIEESITQERNLEKEIILFRETMKEISSNSDSLETETKSEIQKINESISKLTNE